MYRYCSQCWWFISEPIPTALLYSKCNCGWPEMFLLMCIETARNMYTPIYILSHWSFKNMRIHIPILTYATQMFSFTHLDPEYSLEGQMLKLQYFGHLMWRADSWEKTWCWERLRAGEGGDGGWDGWMASPAQWTWVWVSSGSWCWTEKPGVLQSMGSQSQTRLSNLAELNWT